MTREAALRPSPAPLPAWSRPESGGVADTEVSSFQAAVALAALDGLVRARPDWLGLFAMRQALDGAEAICRLLRLGATREQLRDEEHWRRAGEAMTESGRIHALLRKVAAHRPDPTMLNGAAEALGLAHEPGEKSFATEDSVTDFAEEHAPTNRQNPIAKAISAAHAFHHRNMSLNTASHASRALDAGALLAADIALAHRLNWPRVIPLLCTADLTLFRDVDGKRLSPHHPDFTAAAWAGYASALHAAWDSLRRLAPRAEAVFSAKLRTKGRAAAIAAILADDCVKAGSLAMLGSERAAFRLLDTLKTRGALRELTGRQVFKLYGV